MKRISIKETFLFVALLLVSPIAANGITLDAGELVGIWDTPDDSSSLLTSYLDGTSWALSDGQKLTELARNEDEFYSQGLVNIPLSPSIFSYNTGSSTSGIWAYLGGAQVDFLAVATSSHFALFGYQSPQWLGMWSTDAISAFINEAGQGMAHITAYSISAVPLPTAAPLFLFALALFGFLQFRQKSR